MRAEKIQDTVNSKGKAKRKARPERGEDSVEEKENYNIWGRNKGNRR